MSLTSSLNIYFQERGNLGPMIADKLACLVTCLDVGQKQELKQVGWGLIMVQSNSPFEWLFWNIKLSTQYILIFTHCGTSVIFFY